MTMPVDGRLLDLLVSRATEGLDGAESLELRTLLAGRETPAADDIERAAAAADLAWMHEHDALEAMPRDVLQRMRAQADAFGRSLTSSRPDADSAAAGTTTSPAPAAPVSFPVERARPGGLPAWSGWLAAAAALVLLAVSVLGGRDGVPTPPVAAPMDSAAARAELLDRAGTIQIAWAPPEPVAYRDVRGDVVWNNASQSGFMRLAGLPANRPASAQYQLWIVDPERDQNPIDGGVFDIPPDTDEVVVPIDAKLDVTSPKAFAITLEQPGGVVVSDGPLLVVAAVEG